MGRLGIWDVIEKLLYVGTFGGSEDKSFMERKFRTRQGRQFQLLLSLQTML
jgi:hypothetical protein